MKMYIVFGVTFGLPNLEYVVTFMVLYIQLCISHFCLQNNSLTRPIVYIVSDVEQKQANKLKDIIKRHQVKKR